MNPPLPAVTPARGSDAETRLADDHHAALRVWLRLLTCTRLIERHIRERLRVRFSISLPRFDLMAQLERAPEGLKMSELSKRLMVTGGNVTGLTDQLVAEGLVERVQVPADRRAFRIRLTAKGRQAFDRMAEEHERWVISLLQQVPERDLLQLHALLGRVKTATRGAPDAQDRKEER